MGRVEELSISVRLALTAHVVLVPPCLPEVQPQPHRHCYFLDCPRKCRLRPLLCFHNLFTCHHALQRRWKDEKSPALSVLRANTLYWPYWYDFVSDTVKCWTPKIGKHFGPNSAQVEMMSQTVPSAMWPGYRDWGIRLSNEQHKDISVIMRITRMPNLAAISRADIIVMSASQWGPHQRYTFLGDSFSKVIGA